MIFQFPGETIHFQINSEKVCTTKKKFNSVHNFTLKFTNTLYFRRRKNYVKTHIFMWNIIYIINFCSIGHQKLSIRRRRPQMTLSFGVDPKEKTLMFATNSPFLLNDCQDIDPALPLEKQEWVTPLIFRTLILLEEIASQSTTITLSSPFCFPIPN